MTPLPPRSFHAAPGEDGTTAQHLSWREKQILALLAVHLAFPAWALGGMTMWGQLVSLATGLAAVLTALLPRVDSEIEPPGGGMAAVQRSPAVWGGALLLLYVAIQALNPAWRYVESDGQWWMEPLAHATWLPTGMDTPYAWSNPWRSLVIFAGAWLGVVAIVAGVARRRAARVLLTFVVLNATAVALLGLAQQITNAPGIFWDYVPPNGATWFGTFIYRNHASAFLGAALGVALALAVSHRRRTQRRMERSGPGPVFALLAIFIGLGAVFSFSRTGALLAAALLGGVALWRAGVWWARPHARGSVLAGLALSVVLVGTATYGFRSFDYEHLQQRMNSLPASREEFTEERRVVVYQAALDMLQSNWIYGWGAGGFRFFFPVFQENYPTIRDTVRQTRADGSVDEVKMPDPLFWEHAHNEFLEFPIELGVVGTLCFLAGPLWWFGRCLRARVWRFAPGVIILAGLGLTVLHAGVDFVFQNPAVLLQWSALWPLLERWLPPLRATGPTPPVSSG